MDVIEERSPNDRRWSDAAPQHYARLRKQAIAAIRLAFRAAGRTDPKEILDFPSGHGRVLRYLKAVPGN